MTTVLSLACLMACGGPSLAQNAAAQAAKPAVAALSPPGAGGSGPGAAAAAGARASARKGEKGDSAEAGGGGSAARAARPKRRPAPGGSGMATAAAGDASGAAAPAARDRAAPAPEPGATAPAAAAPARTRFAARAPLPPARPAALDAPATAGAVDAAPAAHAVRAAQADAAQAGAVQAEAAPQPAPAPGGFDLFGFLAGKPRRPAEQPQEAAAPPAGAEEEGRGGRHARGAARDARARALVAALIERHARANGVPVALADAVVRVESRYNAAARNGPYLGLMQIHLNTARAMGYAGDARGLLDPDVNLRYGMKYLGAAYRLAGGDTCGAIMKYQGGHRAVRLTPHAARYCARVRTMMAAR